MSKSFINISVVLVVGLILAFHATDVQGVDLNSLRPVYAGFFNGLLGVLPAAPQAVTDARTAYDSCAAAATSYEDLINCAITAYNSYNTPLRNVLATRAQQIVNVYATFLISLQPLTADALETEQGIQIPDFLTLVDEAQQRLQAAAQQRIQAAAARRSGA